MSPHHRRSGVVVAGVGGGLGSSLVLASRQARCHGEGEEVHVEMSARPTLERRVVRRYIRLTVVSMLPIQPGEAQLGIYLGQQ